MPEDGSTNWDLPPRFDDSPDEADEMVQDYVADLPLERNFNWIQTYMEFNYWILDFYFYF